MFTEHTSRTVLSGPKWGGGRINSYTLLARKRGFGELEGMLAVEGLEVTIKGGLVQVWRDERSEFKIFIGCNSKTASVK